MSPDLHLHEELMLLVLRDREGTVDTWTNYPYALGGAVAAELLMAGRLEVFEDGKEKRVRVIDESPLGDPLLDEWLRTIAEREKPRTLRDWVSRIAVMDGLRHRVARGLCRKGILRTDEDKVLWIFTRKIYPELDPGPERELRRRVEEGIFGDAEGLSPRTVVLIALAYHTGILARVFDKDRVKEREDVIEEITSGQRIGDATEEAVQAMQAAVTAAVIVPMVVAT